MALSPPASLASLLRSNDPPSPSQKVLVGGILRDQQTELSALGDEISRLESTLRALRKKHADLAAEMHRYSCILAPIRHLPPDIVGEIFLYFAPSAIHPSDFGDRRYDAPLVKLPWKLGQICHQWRAISLSLGKLWAVLDLGPQWRFREWGFASHLVCRSWVLDDAGLAELPVPPEFADNVATKSIENALPLRSPSFPGWKSFPTPAPDENSDGFEIATSLDYIEKSLQRSGNRLFSFRIWGHDFAAPTLLESLLEHSALWQEIVFIAVSPDPPYRICRFDGKLAALRKIAFIRSHYIPPVFPYHIANITDLTLVEVSIYYPNCSQIPWSQLIRYCEMDCRWNDEQDRLASYRELTNLRILRLQIPDHVSLLTDTPIVLPKLSAASFHFRRYFGPHTLHAFDMPALEDFAVECFSTCHFDTLIPYSSPRLNFFRVRAPMCPRDELCALDGALEKFQDLTEITIDVHDFISNANLSRLIPCDDQPPFAPKLAVLRLTNRSFIDEDCKWETLLKMLQGRFQPTIQGISRLRTFEFATEYWASDVYVRSGLKALAARNGWDIRVHNKYLFPSWDDEWRLG